MLRTSSLLKNTRLDREYELVDISKKLKIPVKYLEAIENEDVINFPSEPYCSLTVKDYADHLGLNGQEILSLFRRDFEQKKKNKIIRKREFSFTPQFTFKFLTSLFLFVFLSYLTSEYIKFNRPPKLKIDWPDSVSGETFDLSGTTDPDSTVRINGDLIIVQSNGDFQKKLQNFSKDEIKIVVESKSPSGKSTIEEKSLSVN
jgi:hypothetical protein